MQARSEGGLPFSLAADAFGHQKSALTVAHGVLHAKIKETAVLDTKGISFTRSTGNLEINFRPSKMFTFR
jgi:hypothetical protein